MSNLGNIASLYGFNNSNDLIQVVATDQVFPIPISQLNCSISNSVLKVKILKIFVNGHTSTRNDVHQVVLIRDERDSILLFCWGKTFVNQCNKSSIGNIIYVKYADVRIKKNHQIATTSPFELHLTTANLPKQQHELEYSILPSISRVPVEEIGIFDDSFPIFPKNYTNIDDILEARVAINSIVNIFVIIKEVGPIQLLKRNEKSHINRRNIKCIDESSNNKKLTISAWSTECDLFDCVEEGMVVFIESVKITFWNNRYQVSTTYNTVLHNNVQTEEAKKMREWWYKNQQMLKNPPKCHLITEYFQSNLPDSGFKSGTNAIGDELDTVCFPLTTENSQNCNKYESNLDDQRSQIKVINHNFTVWSRDHVIDPLMKINANFPSTPMKKNKDLGEDINSGLNSKRSPLVNLKKRKNLCHKSRICGISPLKFNLDPPDILEITNEPAILIDKAMPSYVDLIQVSQLEVKQSLRCTSLISKIYPKKETVGYCVSLCSHCLKYKCDTDLKYPNIWKYLVLVSFIDDSETLEGVLLKDNDMEKLANMKASQFIKLTNLEKRNIIRKLEWRRYDVILCRFSSTTFAVASIEPWKCPMGAEE